MTWQQLELQLPALHLPQAEALLELLGAASVTLLGAGPDEILEPDPGTAPVWTVTRIRALFAADADLDRVTRVLEESFGTGISVVAETLDDSAWTDALSAEPREQRIGNRLLITSSRDSHHNDGCVAVRLNRGLGFGTGEHATTRLCLEWLDAELTPGAKVLDYGCGSGILAITALKLGARQAWAVDIEPQALEATAANSTLNVVSDNLWIGSPERLPEIEADVILANILARPLIQLAPRFATMLSDSGTAVLSGVLVEQREEVREAYAAHFLELDERVLDGWVCLVARHLRY
ncbi:MAG: methyltransferase [Gammaproteobacteria bacterium]|nr:methyltransferase [Gammaproteobacteria bacterium]